MRVIFAIVMGILALSFIAGLFFGLVDIFVAIGIVSLMLANFLAGAVVMIFCISALFAFATAPKH